MREYLFLGGMVKEKQSNIMKPEDFGYVVKNNVCLFQKGPLSNWWGGFPNQNGGFTLPFVDMGGFVFKDEMYNYLLDKKLSPNSYHTFNCVEQWMMACKAGMFGDVETFEKILNEPHPKKQKDLGREVKGYNEEMWKAERFECVGHGIFSKFDQNLELKRFLLQFPSDTIFAEAAPWDKNWGIGMGPDDPDALDIYKWKGTNLLGKLIGQTRLSFSVKYNDELL